MPSEATSTEGVKAATPDGDAFTLIGVDQVRPPSVERESATSSCVKPLKRPSDQTA